MRREYNANGGAESYVIIDNTESASDPATKITGFPGKDFNNDIKWIRDNSHLYTGELVNGVLQCKQLSDTDKSKYVDGTSAPITTTDVFMKLPEFWWKCSETSSGSDKWKLDFSKSNKSGWNHWEGNTFIGVYEAYNSSNKIYSYSGKTPTWRVSQSAFKSYARARGNGYQIVTYEAHQIMCLLFYAYYGNTNSQSICGSGGSSYPKTAGNANSLGMTDTTPSNSSSLQTVNFWGLENWWGDLLEWVDNLVTASNNNINVQNINNTTIRTINLGSSLNQGCIKQMVFNINGDTLPKSLYDDDEYSTYYADYSGFTFDGPGIVAARSGSSYNSEGGVSLIDFYGPSSHSYYTLGSRLQYKGNYVILS